MNIPSAFLPALLSVVAQPAVLAPMPTGAFAPLDVEQSERIEAWPELSGGEKAQVKNDVKRLSKAQTTEMSEQAREALLDVGAGAAPYLLTALGKEKDEDAIERIVEVLTLLTGAEHTRVLAESFEHRTLEVRVWSMRRAARFPDAGLSKVAEQRRVAVVGTPEKPPRKKPDAAEVYAVSLLSVSTGSIAGLDAVFEGARNDWRSKQDELLAAVRGIQGPEAVEALRGRLAGGDRKDTVAALRLLWRCGTKDSVPVIQPFLDDEDHTIRSAAINALRCIVDGDEPLDSLPVFDAIERAKKWKERL